MMQATRLMARWPQKKNLTLYSRLSANKNVVASFGLRCWFPACCYCRCYCYKRSISSAFRLPPIFLKAKAALIKACDVMHCQVNLPAQIERISVESNELESPPPEGKAFSLSIQLQNNSATLQSWPHIELILNDEKDKAVLQKAFTPSDYLTDQTVLSKGFAPKSQQNIKVYFELPKLRASGYHVSIFYP